MAKAKLESKLAEVEDSVFTTFCLVWPVIRPWLKQAVDDEEENWDEEFLAALDDLANGDPANASKIMPVVEWNYANWIRRILVNKTSVRMIAMLDKLLDYA